MPLIEHASVGSGPICGRCGYLSKQHRKPRIGRADTRKNTPQDRIIGVDGEGQGRRPHLYKFLAAADEKGQTWSVGVTAAGQRLSTVQCLDFLLSLPKRSLVVGFSFLYDLTKILTDLPNDAIYSLFHEKLRASVNKGRVTYRPIVWNGYSINYINRKFTVSRGDRKTTVWDVFAFYQSSFVKALEDWKIAPQEVLDRMAGMKDKRADFDKLDWREVEAYCKDECYHLAKLVRALIEAHKEAGLPLKTFYGAGSTATVLLDKFGIRDKRGTVPEEMRVPLACAFFGGRFENSHVGPHVGPVYNYDISSAYPYQTTFLPCLEHGQWGLVRRPSQSDIESAQLALVHWRVFPIAHDEQSFRKAVWGPYPIRSEAGTIAFPISGKGGWTWKEEFLIGRRFSREKNGCEVEASEAWLYHTKCDCQPFKELPQIYLERLRLGKDTKGIPLKLGPNSVYGKVAQSKGINPPFQSWIWAGNITSGTRAQLLEAFLKVSSLRNVLMLATDGVWSTERIGFDGPRDTGTNDSGKPLGGWEEKRFDAGVFCVRPGIYFPLNPDETQLKEVRARGLGKKVLYEQWQRITRAWDVCSTFAETPDDTGNIKLQAHQVSRFVGAKTAIHKSQKGVNRSNDFGEWIPYPIDVSFDPRPKRQKVLEGGFLQPWEYYPLESTPYKPATESEESKILKLAQLIANEQPDLIFGDMDVEPGVIG